MSHVMNIEMIKVEVGFPSWEAGEVSLLALPLVSIPTEGSD
jgi:hypothetical protein